MSQIRDMWVYLMQHDHDPILFRIFFSNPFEILIFYSPSLFTFINPFMGLTANLLIVNNYNRNVVDNNEVVREII